MGSVRAVAVVSKDGSPLLIRQFDDTSRAQAEGLFSALPRLLAPGDNFIDFEGSRYIFQDAGEVQFILRTSITSNVLEDCEFLGTLVDLARAVLEGAMDKATVSDRALELLVAFDECVFDGYRQDVDADDVQRFLQMNSVVEAEAIAMNLEKERLAAQLAAEKAREIGRKRKADGPVDPRFAAVSSETVSGPSVSFMSSVSGGGVVSVAAPAQIMDEPAAPRATTKRRGKGGLVLAGKAAAQPARLLQDDGEDWAV